MNQKTAKTRRKPERYDQETWLQSALEVLAHEGGAKLRVEAITSSLNVTKGSFYHHFRDRGDFVDKLSDYWESKFTSVVIRDIGALPCSGAEKLYEAMRLVAIDELDKYDIAFRSWAAQDPRVAEKVRRVDISRYQFIRSLFVEMGFSGCDLETRVRVWLVFAAASKSVGFPSSHLNSEPDILALLDFFVGEQKLRHGNSESRSHTSKESH